MVSVGARQATSAKSSARIRLSAATRIPSQPPASPPWRARRLLPNAREASAARLRSPKIKGGSLPLGKRGAACEPGGVYLAVVIVSWTWVGLVPLVVTGLAEKLQSEL